MALVPELLLAKGFTSVRMERPASMKLAFARRADGAQFVFWVKQAWSTTDRFSAVQFGMFSDIPNPSALPDHYFV